jgi:hypothetical protein
MPSYVYASLKAHIYNLVYVSFIIYEMKFMVIHVDITLTSSKWQTSMSVNLQISSCILAKVIAETPLEATPVYAHQDSGAMIQRAYRAFELTQTKLRTSP